MTLKLKSPTNELFKGWNLAWYHHFTHIACAKKLKGYGKNWMHFVYKMNNLFQSVRVSDKNPSVTKAFHFFKLISTPDFLCVHYAPFEATPSICNPFWLHLLFFMLKSWEGYGKNWMHFVYKMDYLFRSIRVSDENSSVTKGFQFLFNYFNSRLFVHSIWTIRSHIQKFQPYLTSFAIFHAFNELFWAKWPWN